MVAKVARITCLSATIGTIQVTTSSGTLQSNVPFHVLPRIY